MSGSVEIKNTVKISFGHAAEKPSLGEMINFAKALDTDVSQLDSIYRVVDERSMCIKYRCEEAMLHTLLHNPEQCMFHYDNGKAVEVRMSNASDHVQYVRVCGLPPEVSDKDVALVLAKYGKVKRTVKEKFPPELAPGLDIYTGIRGVYMDVKQEIPTSLHFRNRKGNIFYEGNKNVCFVCKTEGHRMDSCPKRKPRRQAEKQQSTESRKEEEKQQQDESPERSYAGVVAGSAAADEIEVLDEEVMAIDEATSEVEEQASENQVPCGTETHPLYLIAKRLQSAIEEKKTEERKKLRAREKSGSKQSPPRKK